MPKINHPSQPREPIRICEEKNLRKKKSLRVSGAVSGYLLSKRQPGNKLDKSLQFACLSKTIA
jgi:hypothetical protein